MHVHDISLAKFGVGGTERANKLKPYYHNSLKAQLLLFFGGGEGWIPASKREK